MVEALQSAKHIQLGTGVCKMSDVLATRVYEFARLKVEDCEVPKPKVLENAISDLLHAIVAVLGIKLLDNGEDLANERVELLNLTKLGFVTRVIFNDLQAAKDALFEAPDLMSLLTSMKSQAAAFSADGVAENFGSLTETLPSRGETAEASSSRPSDSLPISTPCTTSSTMIAPRTWSKIALVKVLGSVGR